MIRASIAPTAVSFNGGTNFVSGVGDATLTISQLAGGQADVDITGGVPAVLEGVPVVFQAFVDEVFWTCIGGGPIFEDGFESGDTSAWSAAVP